MVVNICLNPLESTSCLQTSQLPRLLFCISYCDIYIFMGVYHEASACEAETLPIVRICHPYPLHRFGIILPETGAQCVSSARRDLSGGCEVTRIPTATFPLFPYFPKIFINSYPFFKCFFSLDNIAF